MSERFVVRRVDDELTLIRQIDVDTKFFEGLWEIPEGVVYNSYVLSTRDGAIVFDTVKRGYCGEYVDLLSRAVDLREVKYIVSHHGEPDHSGCVKELSDRTGANVLGHALLGRQLNGFYGLTKFTPVKDGEQLRFGGYTVRFIHLPWLHWPETIVSFVEEKRLLFSCDVFGSYGVFRDEVFVDELPRVRRDEYVALARKYFANIIGFYRDWVVKNLNKLVEVGVNPATVMPAHGVSYRGGSVKQIFELYEAWGRGVKASGKTVVLYTSMYGFVEDAVKALVERIGARGTAVKVFTFNDRYRSSVSDFIGEAYDSETVIIATSAYDSTVFPLVKLVADLLVRKVPSNKRAVVVTLNGWGTRVSREVAEALASKGFETIAYDVQVGEREKAIKEVAGKLLEP